MNSRVPVAFFLLAAVSCAGPADGEPRFKITTKKKDDAVDVRTEKDRTLFIVTSPSGIGQAVIERQEAAWPKVVVLRLRLKGLESFTLAGGKTTLQAAVSVVDGKPKSRQWKDGKEDAPLDEKSPYWIGVRVLGDDGKPAKTLPLKDGFFELTLPPAFLEAGPPSMTVSWIDFFRG